MDWIISSALAEGAPAAAPQGSPLMNLMPLAIIFVIFYFFVLRPQQKRIQTEQDMNKSLSKGDEVYTKAGVIGKIHGITEKLVTLEVSEGVRIKVLRSQIGGLAAKIFEPEPQKK